MAIAVRMSHRTPVTAIGVSNFKSIGHEVRIELGSITLLAGANSSGKSSFMQPLLLIKQTLDKPFDPDGIDISGPNASFSSTDQIFSTFAEKNPSFSVRFCLEDSGDIVLSYARRNEGGIYLVGAGLGTGNAMRQFEINGQLVDGDDVKLALAPIFDDLGKGPFTDDVNEYEIVPSRGLPSLLMRGHKFGDIEAEFAESIKQLAGSLIHVPGLRGNPARTYPTSAVSNRFPGLFTEYVASVVHRWKNSKDKRLNVVGRHLKELGLTWKVDTRSIDDTRVEVRVARLPTPRRGGAHDMVSIADVGFGVSQVLPLVVALLVAEKGQVVYIEQPEIHLHPRAQVALGQILCEAAARGVKVVVETLSGHLVLALQALVAEGKLPPEKLKLHWFTRGPTGMTDIRLAEVEADGSFGDWPEDFGDVELEAQRRYLDAAAKRWAHV